MLDHFSDGVSLSELSPAELDMIAGAGTTVTTRIQVTIDAEGNGTMTVTETTKDD